MKAPLNERIPLLMARAGIKNRDALSQKLGYSRTQLHALETGKITPSDRFLAALEALEEMHGLCGSAQIVKSEVRLADDASEYLARAGPPGPVPMVPATDAEITGLAALVSLRAAQIAAGQSIHDVPIVADALERALGSRGWRVRE